VSTQSESLQQRVQSSYARLSAVASNLNAASDELSQSVMELDESLKTLNLGTLCWYKYAGEMPDFGRYWSRYIGYAKVGSRWGISLSRTSGHTEVPEDGRNDEWLFNDAPRDLRIEAVEHIPLMIEKLIETAEATVSKVLEKAAEAKELAAALKPVITTKPTHLPSRNGRPSSKSV
jgi:hypothetical protein